MSQRCCYLLTSQSPGSQLNGVVVTPMTKMELSWRKKQWPKNLEIQSLLQSIKEYTLEHKAACGKEGAAQGFAGSSSAG
jgi:hypothetical protein